MKIDPCYIQGEPGRVLLSPLEYEIVDKYKTQEEFWGEDNNTYTGRYNTYFQQGIDLEVPNEILCKAMYLNGDLLGYLPHETFTGGISKFDGLFDITVSMPKPPDEEVVLAYYLTEYEKSEDEQLKNDIVSTCASLVKYNIRMPILLIRIKYLLAGKWDIENNLLINVDKLNKDIYYAKSVIDNICEEDIENLEEIL